MVKVERRKPEPPQDEIVVTMDLATAAALRKVLANVGGDLDGPRGKLDKLAVGLARADVDPVGRVSGSVYFQ